MITLTMEQWCHLGRHDYRCSIDGKPYVLTLDPTTGATVLAPVTLIIPKEVTP